jgi:hypothetical protein
MSYIRALTLLLGMTLLLVLSRGGLELVGGALLAQP